MEIKKFKNYIINGSLSLLSFTIIFSLAELITRKLLPAPQTIIISSRNPTKSGNLPVNHRNIKAKSGLDKSLYIETPTGIRLRPNVKVIIENDELSHRKITICTNSLGYRNPEIGKKTKTRVLFLGDSITFGLGLNEEETFVRIIEKLSENTPTPLETINAGVTGMGLQNELALLMETGIKIKPDIVVLDFYLNDFQPSPGVRLVKVPPILKKSWLIQHLFRAFSIIVFAWKKEKNIVDNYQFNKWFFALRKKYPNAKGNPVKERMAFNSLLRQNFRDWGIAWSEEAWRLMSPFFWELKKQGEINKFQLLIVVFPVKWQVLAKFECDYPQKKIRKLADELEVPLLDLLPLLKKNCENSSVELFYDQCHLTPHGNEIVAKYILKFIQKNIK